LTERGAPATATEVVDRFADLDARAAAWDDLAAAAPGSLAAFGHAWVRAFLEHRRPRGTGWRVAFAREGGALVGVLPLLVDRRGPAGALAPLLRSPTDEHAFVGGPLLAAGPDRLGALRALFDAHLGREPRAAAILLQRTAHCPEARLVRPTRGRWLLLRRPGGAVGCRLGTRDAYAEHWDRLGAKTRKGLRNAENRLRSLGAVEHRVVTDPAELPDALERFFGLEAAGWKGRDGTAITADPRARAFYEDAARRLAVRGAFRAHLLEIGGRPVAGELCAQAGPSLLVQKIAFDEALERVSPGHLLWQRTMRLAHDDPAIEVVDTLILDAIRARWGGVAYDYQDVWLLRARPLALLVRGLPLAIRTLGARARKRLRGREEP
jgi:CelD/BcsL family acetyltransferase involved in cellulose biosynthesis